MIIQRLDLTAFGGFTDFSLDLSGGPKRFHIVFGPNESGKSTSLRAITSLLYGIPNLSSDGYLHPNSNIRIGGQLVDDQGTVLDCVRRRGRKDTLRDGSDTAPIDEGQLQRMLGGIDQETFEHRFGISHEELVRGGSDIISGGGDLGSILFAAGAGVSRLREIQDQLDKQCAELFVPRGTKGKVNRLLKDLTAKKTELRDAQVPPADFKQQKDKLDSQKSIVTELLQHRNETATKLLKTKALRQALPLLPRWESARNEFNALADVATLDEAFSSRRRQAATEQQVAERELLDLGKRLARLTDSRDTLVVNQNVLDREAEIESLFQRLGARREARETRKTLQRKISGLDRQMSQLLREWQIELPDSNDVNLAEAIDSAVARLHVGDAVRMRVNELSRQHEKLTQQRDDAAQQVAALEQRIADLEDQLPETVDNESDPESINQLLDTISHPTELLNRLEDQQSDVERAKQTCESHRRRLCGTEASASRLAEIRLPSDTVIQQLTKQLAEAASAVTQLKTKQEDLIQQRNETKRRIRTDNNNLPLPTLADLQQARLHRDQLLAAWGDSQAESTIAELQRAVENADQIADSIRQHHELVHQRSRDMTMLNDLDEEISECEAAIDSAVDVSDSAQLQWNALWQRLGVQADTPARMQRWIADHAQLVESVDQYNQEKSRIHELQQRIQSTCDRLRLVVDSVAMVGVGANADQPMGGTLFAQEDSQVDILRLYDEVLRMRRRLNEDQAKRIELQSRLLDAKQRLPEAQSQLAMREKQVAQWQKDWDASTSSFAQTTDGTPPVIVELLGQVKDVMVKKRERDDLVDRIDAINEDEGDFKDLVTSLATVLEVAFHESEGPQIADDLIRNLYDQLQTARNVATKRQSVQQQIFESQQQQIAAQQRKVSSDVTLEQLCGEVGCETVDQLIEYEQLSQKRASIENELLRLQEQIQALAGGAALQDFVDHAQSMDGDELALQIEQFEHQIESLNQEVDGAQQRVGALQNELERIDGSSVAADLSQDIQCAHGDLARDADEYARLSIARMILRRAIDHYRKENQGPVLTYAQEFFSMLTCRDYQSLRVDCDGKGEPVLYGVRSGDDKVGVPAGAMSTGTADSLYLAMRLASLRHQLRSGTRIPFIVDDCLVQLDNLRTVAALNAFSTLSTETQVVLFTHHEHVVQLANQHLGSGDFHVHTLA